MGVFGFGFGFWFRFGFFTVIKKPSSLVYSPYLSFTQRETKDYTFVPQKCDHTGSKASLQMKDIYSCYLDHKDSLSEHGIVRIEKKACSVG